MIITAYTDGDFNSECKSALELPVNPAKVKLGKGVRYAEDKQLGSLNGSNVYVRYQPEILQSEGGKKHFSKHSPDVSRMVTLKEGQTLSALCYEVYGDALLVGQVARFNNLNGYRNIPAGTQILIPMLKKG